MSIKALKHSTIKIFLVMVWVLFTVTLVIWWIYFGLGQVDRLMRVQHEEVETLVRYQKMLIWEGCAMLLSITAGGGYLLYYMYREMREGRKVKQFFAAFTHEIKTPLASARLKGEILKERIHDPDNISLVSKMLADVGRLSLRLENSLFLADEGGRQLFIEPIDLGEIITGLRDFWPGLTVDISGTQSLKGDKRIFDTVIANIMQNAVIHGKATRMTIQGHQHEDGTVELLFEDNGEGFRGERATLTHLYTRHYAGSGSGIGLYLVKNLCSRMGGVVSFPLRERGFAVKIVLQRAI